MKELNIKATTDNLDEVLAFVNAELEERDCSPKIQMQIEVAVEVFPILCNVFGLASSCLHVL